MKRVDLNYSKNYIMCGNPCFEEQKHGRFEEEFEKAVFVICEYVDASVSNEDQADEMKEKILDFAGVCRDVYFEMGIRVGAKLINQLLFECDETIKR